MIDKLIKEVYSSVINILLCNIDEQDKEEVSRNYFNYLYSLYSDKDINNENYEKLLNIIVKIEKADWESRDKDTILFYFKNDESYNIISKLSKKAYTLASNRCQNNDICLSPKEAEMYIETMIKALDNVEDFNKIEAEELVSEGILDFEYACGNSNDITSLRIAHIKR